VVAVVRHFMGFRSEVRLLGAPEVLHPGCCSCTHLPPLLAEQLHGLWCTTLHVHDLAVAVACNDGKLDSCGGCGAALMRVVQRS
jgi:hypothetical protein